MQTIQLLEDANTDQEHEITEEEIIYGLNDLIEKDQDLYLGGFGKLKRLDMLNTTKTTALRV